MKYKVVIITLMARKRKRTSSTTAKSRRKRPAAMVAPAIAWAERSSTCQIRETIPSMKMTTVISKLSWSTTN